MVLISGLNFPSKVHKKKAIRSHSGVGFYGCTICDKKFVQYDCLARHLEVGNVVVVVVLAV